MLSSGTTWDNRGYSCALSPSILCDSFQHYICSNNVEIPNLTITYSLDSIMKISENNDRYLEEMELTREGIEKERERNVQE